MSAKIFLAHAKEDQEIVIQLYRRLQEKGYEPWLDKLNLFAGQNWHIEIAKAIKNSDFFLACLSKKSVHKRGYVQRELKMALNVMADMPPGQIYLIPLRLDNCSIPEITREECGISLSNYQWADLFEPDGFEKLLVAIDYQFEKLISNKSNQPTIRLKSKKYEYRNLVEKILSDRRMVDLIGTNWLNSIQKKRLEKEAQELEIATPDAIQIQQDIETIIRENQRKYLEILITVSQEGDDILHEDIKNDLRQHFQLPWKLTDDETEAIHDNFLEAKAINNNVCVLGADGVGKTSYFIGTYGTLQSRKFPDWACISADSSTLLKSQWESLKNIKAQERWPMSTSVTQTYSFYLNYGNRLLMHTRWQDYRGGALGDTLDKSDVTSLLQNLQSSDCIFLCFPGKYLSSLNNSTFSDYMRKAYAAGIQHMFDFLADFAKQNKVSNDKPFPIVILLTKYDLCTHMTRSKVIEIIQKIFNPLFTDNSGWLVMICPVSLGKELAESPNDGEINPVNLHVPIAFSAYCKLRNCLLEARKRNKTKSYEIERKIQLLASELSNRDIYLSGKAIQIEDFQI